MARTQCPRIASEGAEVGEQGCGVDGEAGEGRCVKDSIREGGGWGLKRGDDECIITLDNLIERP